jgi:hypothetical protein
MHCFSHKWYFCNIKKCSIMSNLRRKAFEQIKKLLGNKNGILFWIFFSEDGNSVRILPNPQNSGRSLRIWQHSYVPAWTNWSDQVLLQRVHQFCQGHDEQELGQRFVLYMAFYNNTCHSKERMGQARDTLLTQQSVTCLLVYFLWSCWTEWCHSE